MLRHGTPHGGSKEPLEIGCASCPLTGQMPIDRYTGIDPSQAMIDICRSSLPREQFIRSDFEAFYSGERYDYLIATFGAASYIHPDWLPWVNNLLHPGGALFLMFYQDDYIPETYRKTGIFLDWYQGNYRALSGDLSVYHNYLILRNR